jgi:hypothetical protein
MGVMRTTITLDEDVVKTVRQEMRTGKTFKDAVNDLIRLGHHRRKEQVEAARKKSFKVRAKNLGTYPHLDYDNIAELLDRVEGPFHK